DLHVGVPLEELVAALTLDEEIGLERPEPMLRRDRGDALALRLLRVGVHLLARRSDRLRARLHAQRDLVVLDPLAPGVLVGMTLVDPEDVNGPLLLEDVRELPFLHVSEPVPENRAHLIGV